MFDESCICVDADESASHVWTTEVKRAKKAHFCCECERCIPPGAPYRREVAIFEGRMETYKTCRLCSTVRDDLMSCGWLWTGLWELLSESLAEYGDHDREWLKPPRFPITVHPPS